MPYYTAEMLKKAKAWKPPPKAPPKPKTTAADTWRARQIKETQKKTARRAKPKTPKIVSQPPTPTIAERYLEHERLQYSSREGKAPIPYQTYQFDPTKPLYEQTLREGALYGPWTGPQGQWGTSAWQSLASIPGITPNIAARMAGTLGAQTGTGSPYTFGAGMPGQDRVPPGGSPLMWGGGRQVGGPAPAPPPLQAPSGSGYGGGYVPARYVLPRYSAGGGVAAARSYGLVNWRIGL